MGTTPDDLECEARGKNHSRTCQTCERFSHLTPHFERYLEMKANGVPVKGVKWFTDWLSKHHDYDMTWGALLPHLRRHHGELSDKAFK